MSLVGDIIMQLRRRIPDAPPVITTQPVIDSLATTTINDGDFLQGGSIAVVVTAVTPWGETLPSVENLLLNATGNAILLTVTLPPSNSLIGFKTYIGFGGAGSESFAVFTPVTPPAAGPITVTIGSYGPADAPPLRSTAFMPDGDGNFIGAATAYQLLNQANAAMVKICGGIVDVTGVRTVVNNSMYRLQAPFYTFTNAWFDGYPMDIVPRSFMFLRNSAAGFSGILSYEQDGPQQTIQVWPQSNRTGANSTLVNPMTPFDTTITIAGPSPFLSIGLAQIDSEVVAYSQAQTIGPFVFINGVLRGMGGTNAVAHAINAPVLELNIRLSGYRLAQPYSVGSSLQTLMVPNAWEDALVLHMLSEVRSMEQDDATAKQLNGDFVAMAEKIAKGSRLGRIKPRQIPIWGQQTTDARNVNGIGFGWLIN